MIQILDRGSAYCIWNANLEQNKAQKRLMRSLQQPQFWKFISQSCRQSNRYYILQKIRNTL